MVADPSRDPGEDREDQPSERERAVRRGESDRVRVLELPARHDVRDGRVLRRAPHERQALDQERQREDGRQHLQERHRPVHHAAGDVGRDHEPLPVDPVHEHAGERPEQQRRQEPSHHHPGHGERLGRGAPLQARHQRGHRDEPHPVAEGRHGHRGGQPREGGALQEVLEGRGLGPAKCGDVLGNGCHETSAYRQELAEAVRSPRRRVRP